MDLRERYDLWNAGGFDDEAAEVITSLSTNALRDLQRLGALRTSGGGGRGKRRLWAREALCKAAMTAELRKAGLSLAMGARIAFYTWNTSVMSSDPMLAFPSWEELNGKPYFWMEREPGEHGLKEWLSDSFAVPRHDDGFDTFVHILNGTIVVAESAEPPSERRSRAEHPEIAAEIDAISPETIGGTFEHLRKIPLGRLSDDGLTYYTWYGPRPKRRIKPDQDARSFLEEQYSDEISIDFLNCQFEEPPAREAIDNALANFTVKTSVNVTLAMRMAMRRAMGLPVAET